MALRLLLFQSLVPKQREIIAWSAGPSVLDHGHFGSYATRPDNFPIADDPLGIRVAALVVCAFFGQVNE